MGKPDREVEPHFSHPFRQIVLMLFALGLAGIGAFMALPQVLPVFEANPWLNGFIGFVFIIGVLACFWQVFTLIGSTRWIARFAAQAPGHEMVKAPSLLAPLATLLRARDTKMQIASSSARSILDSVAQRIDEAREITRYIVNLLIFLGLLGTFYGLATTVPAVVETIRSLAPQEGETGQEVFTRLMSGLESQLGGMGVAFASSLLGLAGSLIVGLLELFAGHGQNRFYRELEEWMSTITRLGLSGDGDGEGGGDQGALTRVMDYMAEQMEAMQMQMVLSQNNSETNEEDREKLNALLVSVKTLSDKMSAPNPLDATLERVALGQEQLIIQLSETAGDHSSDGMDAESRMRLRSIDVQMLRILEELSAGRQETVTDLRSDMATMTKAIVQVRNQLSGRATPKKPRAPEQG
ncbi:MotA/TolQ/ExbB proton channel family protein, probably associated with flagella [hydrothermal vent metagenome]|uniref:MotA/TolQ/ExbB proton channel family protein, probably associated with flagella n=1 Tax=hydrothermal vent metagenome TaxID=652676 RepID=A0A3B0SBQ2_9ZZZZ